MYYLGARYTLPNEKTMIGAEYNHGSEYWFNFTPAQDDIIAAKTNTRGNVYEAYVIHKIRDRFSFRLGYIRLRLRVLRLRLAHRRAQEARLHAGARLPDLRQRQHDHRHVHGQVLGTQSL